MSDEDYGTNLTKIATQAARIAALEAGVRKIVADAYNEGFIEGMREHTSSRGGKPWTDAHAYYEARIAALAPAPAPDGE